MTLTLVGGDTTKDRITTVGQLGGLLVRMAASTSTPTFFVNVLMGASRDTYGSVNNSPDRGLLLDTNGITAQGMKAKLQMIVDGKTLETGMATKKTARQDIAALNKGQIHRPRRGAGSKYSTAGSYVTDIHRFTV